MEHRGDRPAGGDGGTLRDRVRPRLRYQQGCMARAAGSARVSNMIGSSEGLATWSPGRFWPRATFDSDRLLPPVRPFDLRSASRPGHIDRVTPRAERVIA